jgi:hypothetical protein
MIRHSIRVLRDQVHTVALQKHRSNLPYRQARIYTRFLKKAQAQCTNSLAPISDAAAGIADSFRRDQVVSFWSPEIREQSEAILEKLRERETAGEDIWDLESSLYKGKNGYVEYPEFEAIFRGLVGDVLRGIFDTEFKLHHFRLRKSVRTREFARGSELWHSDTGPGTCINMVIGLTELSEENGATQVLPWGPTADILAASRPIVRNRLAEAQAERSINREEMREIQCRYNDERVEATYADQIRKANGPAGTVLMWNANSLHRGGWPRQGEERYVMLCHAYPSHQPANWDRYRIEGCGKFAWPNISGRGTQPFPSDPAEDF